MGICGGGLQIAGEGTFVFNIQSDDGVINTIKILQSLYVPGIKLPLLSPQHWAETARPFPYEIWDKNGGRWGGLYIAVEAANKKKENTPQSTYQYFYF